MGTDRTLPSAKADYEIRNDGSVSIKFSDGIPLTFPSIAEALAYLRKAGFKDIADRLEADPLADMPIEAWQGPLTGAPFGVGQLAPGLLKPPPHVGIAQEGDASVKPVEGPFRYGVLEEKPEPREKDKVDSKKPWTTLFTVLGGLHGKGEISDDVYYEAYGEIARQEEVTPPGLDVKIAQGILDRMHTGEWLQDRRDVVDIRNDNRASQKFEEAIIDVLDSELARQKGAALGMDTQLGNLDAAQEYIDARKIIWRDEFREWYETGSEGLEGFKLRDFQDRAPQLWLARMIQGQNLAEMEDHPYWVGLDLSGLDNFTIDQLMSGWFTSLQARGIAVREQKSRRDTIRARLQTAITTFKKSAASEDYDGDPALKQLFTEASNFFKAMLENGTKEDALIDLGLDATGTALEADRLITDTMDTLFADRHDIRAQIVAGSPSQSYVNIANTAAKSSVDKTAYRDYVKGKAKEFRDWSRSASFAGDPALQDIFRDIATKFEEMGSVTTRVKINPGEDVDITAQRAMMQVIETAFADRPDMRQWVVPGQLDLTMGQIGAATVTIEGAEEEALILAEQKAIAEAQAEQRRRNAQEDATLLNAGIQTIRAPGGEIIARYDVTRPRPEIQAAAAKTQAELPSFLAKLGLTSEDLTMIGGEEYLAGLTSGEIPFDATAKSAIVQASPALEELLGIARNVGYGEGEIDELTGRVVATAEDEFGDVSGLIQEQMDAVTARDVELDDLAMDLEEEFVGLTGGGGELNALLGSLRARRAKAQEEGDLGIVQELTKNIQFIQKNMPTPAGKPQQTGVTVSTTAMGQPIAGTERQFVTAEAARQRPATPLAMARQQIVERQQQGLDPYSFSPEEIEARVMRDAAAQDRTAQLSEIQAAQANELERQQRIGARAQARADYQAAALKPEKKKQPTANLQGRRVSR